MRSRSVAVLLPFAALVLASCKGAEAGPCDPTDPLCGGGGGGATVSTVTVASSIDTVVAVGGPMATMTAVARTGAGATVPVTFNWSSQTPATATVNPMSGVVTAVAAGMTNIVASQDNNTVTGQLRLRAVNADLAGLGATLTEPFAAALRNALTATPQGAVNGFLTTCQTNVTSGNLLAINTCLNSLIAVPGTGTDNVLLTLLDLYFIRARAQLQL